MWKRTTDSKDASFDILASAEIKCSMSFSHIRIMALFLLVTVSLGACTTTSAYRLRPVDLQILDAKTNKPLRDITVHQIIGSDIYGDCIKLLPRLEPTDSRYIIETKKTNESGRVSFSERLLKLACSEHISHEYLIINIDLKPAAYERLHAILSVSHAKALVNFGISPSKNDQEENTETINVHYRGHVIYGSEYPMGSDWFHGKQKLFDVVTNGEGLLAPSQNFTISLEPKN